MTDSRPPKGSGAAGRRLWRSVLDNFELDEHEMTLLRQACAVADTCEDLQNQVAADGAVLSVRGELRAHPALVELRQQRILLTRLIVALRVPLGEEESEGPKASRPQRRGTGRVYAIKGVS